MSNTTIATRQISVIQNGGGTPVSINSTATTFGELKSELDRQGVNYANSSVIEGVNQTQLVSNESKLPDGAFSLFIVGKVKAKSGITYDFYDGNTIDDIDWTIVDEDDVDMAEDIIKTLTEGLAEYARRKVSVPQSEDQKIWEKLNSLVNGDND